MNYRGLLLSFTVTLTPAVGFAQAAQIACGEPYTVSPGDTLSKISAKAYGVSAFEILHEANKAAIGENPNHLLVGQKLIVPCRDGSSTSTAAVEVEAAVEEETTETPVEIAPAPASDGPVVLTFNKASDPRFVINAGIINPYLELIEQSTEGRVQFVDPTEMNRNPLDQFDLVQSGEFDATYVLNQYIADTHPLLQLPMVPLMGGSAEQTAVSLWNLHDDYLSKTDYFDDAHVLGFVAAPAAHIWHRADNAAESGEDILDQNIYPVPYFEGLDIIGPPRVQARNATLYGAHNEATDGPMTFMMAHGAARGAGIWNHKSGRLSVTEVENGIYTPTFTVIMSNEAWSRISAEDQEIINGLSGLALSHRSSAWDDFDNGHRQVMLDTGLSVSYPDKNLLREIEGNTQEKLSDWSLSAEALGIPADQAIAAYRADLASLRYLLIFR